MSASHVGSNAVTFLCFSFVYVGHTESNAETPGTGGEPHLTTAVGAALRFSAILVLLLLRSPEVRSSVADVLRCEGQTPASHPWPNSGVLGSGGGPPLTTGTETFP